jgi:hypothetical protein
VQLRLRRSCFWPLERAPDRVLSQPRARYPTPSLMDGWLTRPRSWNFSAVANYAQQAVATTGTVIGSSIVVLSGPGKIASGKLTSDVTTSAGTSSLLSNTGVLARTYGDIANVSRIMADNKEKLTDVILIAIRTIDMGNTIRNLATRLVYGPATAFKGMADGEQS